MKTASTLIATIGLLAASTAGAAVNINTAGADELESLSGIGTVKAAAIVAYRDNDDGFQSKDELGDVDGIGPATLDGIREEITLGSE